ncbi:hypothetical protein [Burkholderia cenocepacia]|uniref:hypothetical protein n=1 Tax=Burkholderia cenocepacia TaxID=95486 RepID=UPI002236F460|nr:hypothetical protein [Burkholderia cenocepacia]MCW5156327.1 hypothetical protein [Burkholderia cenocepacia]
MKNQNTVLTKGTTTDKSIFTEPHYVSGIANVQISNGQALAVKLSAVEHGSKTYVAVPDDRSPLFVSDSRSDFSWVLGANSGNYSAEDSEDDGYHD